MKKCFFILSVVVLFALPVFADFNRTSGLIDIPTPRILPHLGYRIGFDASIAIDAEHSANDVEENIHAALGLGNRFEGYLDIYTFGDFTAAVGFCHKFYDRENFALGWGIHNISYAMDVSEVGHGDSVGWDDDLAYSTKPDYKKPFELGSAFLVSTYSPTKILDLTIGLGRGRYVGYGPHSKYFNSNFYHEQGGDWAVGLLLGLELKPTKNLSFLVDLDGRDANVGLKFRYLPIEFGIALVKAEQFDLSFSPRVSASISYAKTKELPKLGAIAGTVSDKEGTPLAGRVSLLHTDIPQVKTKPETGTYHCTNLKPGIYEIYATVEGYISLRKKVNVIPDKTIYIDFKLERKEPKTGDFIGKVIDIKTKEPIVAKLSIEKIKLSVTSDATGFFKFKDLEPDVYRIKAEAEDYETGFYLEVISAGEKNVVEIEMLKRGMVFTIKGINFDFNKSTIKPESYPIIDEAAAILTRHPEISVEIQGHTDSVGSDAYNLKLSDARANSVRDYLIRVHHIEASRLFAHGYGERRPIADNSTDEGRAQNRRVDFLIPK
ncbi:Peptidoglycan-associated lipoprotein [subsurface metagenome]